MNKNCSIRRFAISLKLMLALMLALPVAAGDLGLRPFSASYDLYEGGMHIAVTEIRLERFGDNWRYRTLTRARGIFSLFTSKQPYAETIFALEQNGVRLREIQIGDAGKEKNHESALFDWDHGRLEVMRKGKRRSLELDGGVYDYQSIHLLAASMGRQQLENATVDFYRRGKLYKSRFVYSGEQRVDVNGEGIGANVYEQVISKSNSKIKYYYDADKPLLPLRIERLESGESPAVLALRKVEWKL